MLGLGNNNINQERLYMCPNDINGIINLSTILSRSQFALKWRHSEYNGFSITGVSIVCSTVCSGADKKYQGSTSLDFVREIHRWPMESSQSSRNAENVSIWWCHHGCPNITIPYNNETAMPYWQNFQKTFSKLAAAEISSDEKLVKITSFLFRCNYVFNIIQGRIFY